MTSQKAQIDPAVLTHDLGEWHQHYGVAPCPACQTERRMDQNALTINLKEDRLLLHCKKFGCNFRDILIAANIIPGNVETDARAIKDTRHTRRELEAKALARAAIFGAKAIPWLEPMVKRIYEGAASLARCLTRCAGCPMLITASAAAIVAR